MTLFRRIVWETVQLIEHRERAGRETFGWAQRAELD